MTPKQQKRAWFIGIVMFITTGAVLVITSALRQQILYYQTPSDVLASASSTKVRLGGYVHTGSLKGSPTGIAFTLTDQNAFIPVFYSGIVPDLFREGQGVIVEGYWDQQLFHADHLLAKHDENYRPRELNS